MLQLAVLISVRGSNMIKLAEAIAAEPSVPAHELLHAHERSADEA